MIKNYIKQSEKSPRITFLLSTYSFPAISWLVPNCHNSPPTPLPSRFEVPPEVNLLFLMCRSNPAAVLLYLIKLSTTLRRFSASTSKTDSVALISLYLHVPWERRSVTKWRGWQMFSTTHWKHSHSKRFTELRPQAGSLSTTSPCRCFRAWLSVNTFNRSATVVTHRWSDNKFVSNMFTVVNTSTNHLSMLRYELRWFNRFS